MSRETKMVTRTCKTQQKSDAFDIDDEARDAERAGSL